ncbi:hypothetical protein BDF20DRAFT_412707 [Mycotypha africana]|uniref:uncharacterized protein n=1 Tax=Mycotypha africana TaxID=64632 RepID=UPI002301DF6D|nr:uncharacterized protein BDF20DRAFT_412707 [Mycotypha africana]KAI8981610.1 hypothetical protein BDF20DRAFT_412707 [Mycotypha africana]
MLNDSESSNDSYKGDTNKLTPLVDELLKLLRVVKKALEGRKQYLQARTVYQRSLNFILAQCNNDNAPQSAISSSNTTTKTTNRSTDISNTIDRLLQTEAPIEDLSSYLHVKKEVEHKIRILLKLLNVPGHEMTRAELITYIRNYGKTEDGSKKEEDNEKSKPLTERFIINDVELAFIRLEGRDLITMVRSKDSSDAIVKLNF